MTIDMATYLPGTGSPDYDTTKMILTPHNVLTEMSEKNQVIHTADDNSEERISFSNDNIFHVKLGWTILSETDAGTIMDFFFDSAKGNGIARTFLWEHPSDSWCQVSSADKWYIVRFSASISRDIQPANIYSVKSIKLRVIDKYDENP